jgi:hypothetical protein
VPSQRRLCNHTLHTARSEPQLPRAQRSPEVTVSRGSRTVAARGGRAQRPRLRSAAAACGVHWHTHPWRCAEGPQLQAQRQRHPHQAHTLREAVALEAARVRPRSSVTTPVLTDRPAMQRWRRRGASTVSCCGARVRPAFIWFLFGEAALGAARVALEALHARQLHAVLHQLCHAIAPCGWISLWWGLYGQRCV